jgi:hypothetical protein
MHFKTGKSPIVQGLTAAGLVLLAAVQYCGGEVKNTDAGPDAQSDATVDATSNDGADANDSADAGEEPNCGDAMCSPTTQECYILYFPGQTMMPQPVYQCFTPTDGGLPSCAGDECEWDAGRPPGCDDAGNSQPAPGACGCYKSPITDLVSWTFCPV